MIHHGNHCGEKVNMGSPSVRKWGYVIKQALSLFESSKLNEFDFKNTLHCVSSLKDSREGVWFGVGCQGNLALTCSGTM